MGLCLSGEADGTRRAAASTTAKLILHDGTLIEFSHSITASDALHRHDLSSACFICNSDDMDFDAAVSAVASDAALKPGQLYFALPLRWLKRPLKAEEMAALAVKASTALVKAGKYGCRGNLVCPVVFSDDREGSSDEDCGGGGGCARRRRSRFSAMLTSIPE